jgi:hypothetical protein
LSYRTLKWSFGFGGGVPIASKREFIAVFSMIKKAWSLNTLKNANILFRIVTLKHDFDKA